MIDGLRPLADALLATFQTVPGPLAAYSAAVVFLGYVVLGVSGFGSALTIVPLLAFQWPLATVVPMVLLLDIQSSLLLARLNVARVDWPELRALVPGMVLGAAAGALLAERTDQPWALALLGVYVSAVAVRGLLGQGKPRRSSRRWAPLFGAAAGAVESISGTAGRLVVIWLGRRLSQPDAMRANVPAALVSVTCCALAGMAVTGQLLQPILWAALLPLTLVAFAGTRLGHHIAGRLSSALTARIIFALLACAGLGMVLRAIH